MKIQSVQLGLCWLIFLTHSSNADECRNMVCLPDTVSHTLYAEHNQQHYLIDVFLPIGYQPKTSEYQFPKYPVIYIVNSRPLALMAAAGRYDMQMARELPTAIIVGIGFADNEGNSRNSLAWHTRDFTPTKDDEWDMAKTVGSGGNAKDFMNFINEQLKPFINSTYVVNERDQTLVGHSFGGLFATYVLFNHTDEFDRYVISSPSLWWDNQISFDFEIEYASNHQDLAKKVYISVGSEEFKSGSQEMVNNNRKMYQALLRRNYPNLQINHRVFDDESHASVMGVSIRKGLKSVFQ